ncbi:transcription termination/antitermination protein NusA [Candidatus Wolfebacteria bacterium]|nr:transcription termination/antitermination protein NusA [Candidatus Wolfebacteria bacterium]
MFDLKNLKRAIDQIAEEKGISSEKILEAVESAIAAAYRKEYGKKGEAIKTKLDLKTGDLNFWQLKTVVDADSVRLKEDEEKEEIVEKNEDEEILPLYNPDRHIFIEEAKKMKADISVGDEMEFSLPKQDEFGRIASQAAKQVILQKIREIERDSIKKEYQGKEGEIISGIVQRMERGNVYVDLGRATAIMFYNEGIPGEHYRIGERLRFYLLAVQEETRVPGLILSRSHPKFVEKLFELEVPEIHDGLVEIKAIAREAGSRTKIAVVSKTEGIDPVGSLVGQRGTRVMAVINELGNEKIDIIEWSENPEKFVGSSLSPAKTKAVEIMPRREARVFVSEDQLSLAIGKGGQNVRLAARLTGWKIDVRSQARPNEVQAEGIAEGVAEAEVSQEIAAEEKPLDDKKSE